MKLRKCSNKINVKTQKSQIFPFRRAASHIWHASSPFAFRKNTEAIRNSKQIHIAAKSVMTFTHCLSRRQLLYGFFLFYATICRDDGDTIHFIFKETCIWGPRLHELFFTISSKVFKMGLFMYYACLSIILNTRILSFTMIFEISRKMMTNFNLDSLRTICSQFDYRSQVKTWLSTADSIISTAGSIYYLLLIAYYLLLIA